MAEKELKQSINAHIHDYAGKSGIPVPDVNRSAKKITGKPRGEMSLEELEDFHGSLEFHFPLKD